MPPQFKNMNELTEYLTILEERIETLEIEKTQLQKRIIEKRLPKTNILNQNFFARAFTIWGHFMVANIIIGTILSIIYLCTMGTLIGSFLQQLTPK